MYENLAVLAVFAFLFSIVAGGLERTPFSGPIIFTAFGLIFGPIGLGLLDLTVDTQGLRYIADLTLALVLFVDAANADLGVLRKGSHIPQRMLLIGLPLVIIFGIALGALFFDGLGFYELAILATILAATDAALGKAVVTNKKVPARIREGLNVESGLNDGLCVPILFTFIALATGAQIEGGSTMLAVTLVAKEIGIGLAVGLGMTALGVWLIKMCDKRDWISEIWLQLTVVALAVSCFAIAQSLHGSGYIAAFVGGILFGYQTKVHTHKLVFASEGTAEALALVTWVAFGAAVVGPFYEYFSWQVVVYALLSLTVIRMLPMFLSLSGTGESNDSKLFLGWFGPRGLASIVFVIIVLGNDLPGGGTIAVTVVCTVTLSILLHGITANPFSNWFAARVAAHESAGQST
ncbi:MAG: cation:proton antiporter [Arenicellales bacterium]|nr:cation:proton antiporter [Arenicellales bacterium]